MFLKFYMDEKKMYTKPLESNSSLHRTSQEQQSLMNPQSVPL